MTRAGEDAERSDAGVPSSRLRRGGEERRR